MPCLLALIAVFFPRVILALLFLFTDYLGRAYETWYWPVIGFFFLPFTTLAYAFAINSNHRSVNGIYLFIILIAFLMDLGSWGGGGYSSKRRR